MARVSNRQFWSLYFPDSGLGLQVLSAAQAEGRRPAWQGSAGPSEAGEDLVRLRALPVIWHNRGRGFGVSQYDDSTENDGDVAYGLRLNARTPGSWMPAGDDVAVSIAALGDAGACTASAIYNGTDLFFAFGRYVVKCASGTDGGPLLVEQDLGAAFVAKRMCVYEGVLYVAGAGGHLWRYNGGWSQSADVSALDLETVFWQTPDEIINQRLIVQDTATSFIHIAENSNPMVLANYSARYQIAGGSYPINSMAAANQVVWFATAGGLAAVDARGYSPILNPYLKTMYSNSLNGEVSFYHDGFVYMSTFQGLDRIDVSSLTRHDTPNAVQPGAGTSAEGPIYGRCTALCAEGGYLLASFYNGADSYVVAGKPDPSAPSGMRWFGSEFHLLGERITHLRVHVVSPANNPCIWVASVAGSTPHLRYVFIPKAATGQQELLQNLNAAGTYTGTMRWAENWSIVMGALDFGDQNSVKLVERYDGATRRLVSGQTELRVFANAEGGDYVQQGTGADPKLASSPRAQLIPTAPATSAYNLGVKVVGIGTTTAPGILNELKGRVELIRELRTSTTYRVVLGPLPDGRMGANMDQDVQETLNALLALQSQGRVAMVDPWGETLPAVKVEQGISWMPQAVKTEGPNAESWVLTADVTVSIIPTSEEQLTSGSTAPPVAVLPAMSWDTVLGWDTGSWA